AHHRVADRPGDDPRARRDDTAGQLHAGYLVRLGRTRLRVEAHALEHVGPVDRGRHDADHDLLRTRFEVVDLGHGQDLGPAVLGQHHCSHGPDPRLVSVLVRPVLPDEADELGAITVAAYTELPGHVHEPDYEAELADVVTRAKVADVLVAIDDDGAVLG